MSQQPSPSFGKIVGDARHTVEAALERAADAVKDAVLDWMTEDEPPADAVDELPPLDREVFAEALRGRLDETLRQVADAINAAPTGAVVAASQERVHDLFVALWCEALELGLRMRMEAAGREPPRGHWAKKFRAMRAAGVPLPLSAHCRPRPD